MNAAARLVFSASRYDHITPLLRQLHWLKAPERVEFKLAVLVYKCRQRTAPSYLFEELCHPADFEARRRLRSASSSSLVVRRTRLSTIGDRAFPVAAARIWNGLPPHPRCLFFAVVWRRTYSDAAFHDSIFFSLVMPVKWLVIIGHVNRSFYLLTYKCRSSWIWLLHTALAQFLK